MAFSKLMEARLLFFKKGGILSSHSISSFFKSTNALSVLNSPFVKGTSSWLIENLIIILDKDKLVVSWNEKSPVMNDCRLGRFENVKLSNMIILLDKDKLVVKENEWYPVLNDCRLGRFANVK